MFPLIQAGLSLIKLAQTTLLAVAIALLFTRPARAWLATGVQPAVAS